VVWRPLAAFRRPALLTLQPKQLQKRLAAALPVGRTSRLSGPDAASSVADSIWSTARPSQRAASGKRARSLSGATSIGLGNWWMSLSHRQDRRSTRPSAADGLGAGWQKVAPSGVAPTIWSAQQPGQPTAKIRFRAEWPCFARSKAPGRGIGRGRCASSCVAV